MLITPALPYRDQIVALLTSERLPFDDLPKRLDNFFVMLAEDGVIAAAGMEVYGRSALLRSVVVKNEYRNQGIAAQMVEKVMETARSKELARVFLLTETAKDYFLNKGFEVISRELVPPQVRQSSEFSTVCPISATVMLKTLI
jgi:amino-acid N-acetyltransferase